MKLAMFGVSTAVGPQTRLGVVLLDGGTENTIEDARSNSGVIVDVNLALAAKFATSGHGNSITRANAYCPADLQSFVTIHESDLSLLDEATEWSNENIDKVGINGEQIRWRLSEITLLPPISNVPVLRDFAAFEDHLENTFSKMGLKIPPAWYEQPTAFKGNSTTMFGHDTVVPWPRYTEKLDYELELAAVIGKPVKDIPINNFTLTVIECNYICKRVLV